jgi:predicted RNA-binding Zn-ribbon protein involved in translation (DUF1610 family)
MKVSPPKLIEIYRARNLPEAHTIRIALEEAGLRVLIEGELLQGVVGDLPMGWATAPRILVEESQVSAAREIIERANGRKTAEPHEGESAAVTRCLACGHVMDEIEVKCPSCGWSFQDQQEAEPGAGDK